MRLHQTNSGRKIILIILSTYLSSICITYGIFSCMLFSSNLKLILKKSYFKSVLMIRYPNSNISSNSTFFCTGLLGKGKSIHYRLMLSA
ncbi:hypothetical protein QTP88_022691 [Uroleucon formosanum]